MKTTFRISRRSSVVTVFAIVTLFSLTVSIQTAQVGTQFRLVKTLISPTPGAVSSVKHWGWRATDFSSDPMIASQSVGLSTCSTATATSSGRFCLPLSSVIP